MCPVTTSRRDTGSRLRFGKESRSGCPCMSMSVRCRRGMPPCVPSWTRPGNWLRNRMWGCFLPKRSGTWVSVTPRNPCGRRKEITKDSASAFFPNLTEHGNSAGAGNTKSAGAARTPRMPFRCSRITCAAAPGNRWKREWPRWTPGAGAAFRAAFSRSTMTIRTALSMPVTWARRR